MLRVCLLSAVPETSCDAEDCSLLLYMGFSGDDRDNVAFQTGYQISQVNQYSVSTLYNSIVQQVCPQSLCHKLSLHTIYSCLRYQCAWAHAVDTTGVICECVQIHILSGMHTEFPTAYGAQVSNVLNNAQTGYVGGEAPPASASGDAA